MKPKLLLLTGLGWAATNPLYRTLKRDVLYSGHCKEPETLYWLYTRDKTPQFYEYQRSKKYQHLIATKGSKFTDTLPENLFSYDATIDDFVDYYTRLYSNPKRKSRPYVTDFSNHNADIPAEFISEIASKLKDNFDVKVLMIVRNPVRRSYSITSAMYRIKPHAESGISGLWHNRDPKSRLKWQRKLQQFPDSISYWKHLLSKDCENTSRFSYLKVYRNWAAHFDMQPVIMEDLWGGNLEPLESFLECKLGSELHPNCYYPEMGTKAPRHPRLKDQWYSDMQDLSEEDLAYGKERLQWIYDDWYNEFKTRPWE